MAWQTTDHSSDNGPEYIGGTFIAWAARQGIRLDHIQPGNPQQNAYIERYNRTVRYDWINHYLFESIDEVHLITTNKVCRSHTSGSPYFRRVEN